MPNYDTMAQYVSSAMCGVTVLAGMLTGEHIFYTAACFFAAGYSLFALKLRVERGRKK